MEPVFKNSFKLNEAQNKEFASNTQKKLALKGLHGVLSALSLFAAMLSGISLIVYMSNGDDFFLLLLIVGILLAIISIFISSYRDIRSRKLFDLKHFTGQNITTAFYDDCFETSINKKTVKIEYAKIWCVLVCGSLIILLYGKAAPVGAAVPVSKFDFKPGSSGDFENFIRNKCPAAKFYNTIK